jgi:hypothetical protein
MREVQSASSGQDLKRWQSLEAVIKRDVLIPPKLRCYPAIEEIIWKTVQQCVLGKVGVHPALHQMTGQITQIMEDSQ